MYQLRASQVLPISPSRAWAFLSDPKNLQKMTPEHMGFRILSGAERGMYQGQLIQYTVSPLPGIPMRWVTEITHVEEGRFFVDEQRFGPYAFWHHKHFIAPHQQGVVMEDVVDYKLPMGILGKPLHAPLVKQQLEKIFRFRAQQLETLFGRVEGTETQLEFKTI